MGRCGSSQDSNTPVLLCFFESQKEEQKNYCLKLKENFHNERIIKFEIKSVPNVPFSIKFKMNGKIHELQKIYDNSEEAMNNTLNAAYQLLNNK